MRVSEAPPVHAVFDCMVFLQGAARQHGPSRACLDLAEAGMVELWMSTAILAELWAVLSRPKLRTKFPVLTETFIGLFTKRLREHTMFLADVPLAFAYPRDPKDEPYHWCPVKSRIEPYLNLAITVRADYLVSRDSDILDLNATDVPDAARFQAIAQRTKIVEPPAFLRALRFRNPYIATASGIR